MSENDTPSITITATDGAGNTSPGSTVEPEVDTTKPEPAVVTSPATDGDRIPVLSGRAEPGATVTIELDLDGDGIPDVVYTTVADENGNWIIDTGAQAPSSGSLPENGLSNGSYDLTITVTDAAGNQTSTPAQLIPIR